MKKVRKAVIPAAGLGTRVLPATKVMPKEMLPIVDKPAIQYIVEEAAASGIEDILIITNRGKGLLEDHFDRAPELERRLAGDPAKEAILNQVVGICQAGKHLLRAPEGDQGPGPRHWLRPGICGGRALCRAVRRRCDFGRGHPPAAS